MVYINHLDNIREDLKIRFVDLDNMYVSEWLLSPLDMKIDNKGYESDLEDELIEMHVNFEAKALFKSKTLTEYWSNINTATKYPNSVRQPNHSYLHSQFHTWLKLVLAM